MSADTYLRYKLHTWWLFGQLPGRNSRISLGLPQQLLKILSKSFLLMEKKIIVGKDNSNIIHEWNRWILFINGIYLALKWKLEGEKKKQPKQVWRKRDTIQIAKCQSIVQRHMPLMAQLSNSNWNSIATLK